MEEGSAPVSVESPPLLESAPHRTDPRGFVVRGLAGTGRAALPIAVGLYASGAIAAGILAVLPLVAAAIAIMIGLQWLHWLRFTYVTGPEDIRVEHGILGRQARSVPYERIQDVSVEQKLLARLFGLAEVRFETGSGGSDEIVLAYVSATEAERLRRLVRERRENAAVPDTGRADSPREEEGGRMLFSMDEGRILTFGLFEFSLVVFAVLLGAAQQFDFLLPFDIWEWGNWAAMFAGQREWIEHSGRTVQTLAAFGGLLGVIALGSVTGVARTFAREYNFLLERTPRGFRRRRGLFNRSDVTLPVHRVQAARVGTRPIRRYFGWYSLKFDSLARDNAGSSSHVVAPFARLDEIWPLLRAAGIEPPDNGLTWRRPLPDPWIVDAALLIGLILVAGAGAALFRISLLPFALALIGAGLALLGSMLSWSRHRHAEAQGQLFVQTGIAAPQLAIAPQVKLQTVEIVQGPIARRCGYATVNFGLAGGTLAIAGLALQDARSLRRRVIESIVEVDFGDLPG